MKVEAFVKDRKEGRDEIVYLFPYGNDELVINGEDVIGTNGTCTELTYYKGDSTRRASISVAADIVVNGQIKPDYTATDFKPEDGVVRLINNDGSSEYDVVMITSYQTMVVDYKQKAEPAIKNKFTKGTSLTTLPLELETGDVLSVKKNGIEIGYDGIQIGDVLKVAESSLSGKRVIEILVSSDVVEGIVTTKKTDDKGNTIVIVDNTSYILSQAFEKAVTAGDTEARNPVIGKGYQFSLDSDGKIAFVDEQLAAEQYGMVYAVGKQDGFVDQYFIRLHNHRGEWKEYPVAKKITFDGNKNQKPADVLVNFPCALNGDINVIAYKLNSVGEIISIDLPEPDDGEGNQDAFHATGNTLADKARQTTEDMSYFAAQMTLYSTSSSKQYYMSNVSKFWYFSNAAEISNDESYALGQKSDLI